MTYGTLCSGIEAPTVAWQGLGWEARWFAEIEPFPSAVLAHHYPTVPNKGDITNAETEWEPVDLICGGTPCQDFSVAGQRAGMAGDRSGLALRFLEIVERVQPTWVVWENVPGCLSTNGGRDFGAFLGGLGECGYGFAYRVLDAQYFGVPQRRRRVFVVGHLGDWRPAAAVLFESHSLQRHPPPSREEGEGTAPGTGRGTPWDCQTKRIHDPAGTAPTLVGDRTGGDREPNVAIYENHPGDSRIKEMKDGISPQINARCGTGGNNLPLVASYWDGGQTADCIDASQVKKGQAMPERRRETAVLEPMGVDWQQQGDTVEGASATLSCTRVQAVAFTQNQEGDLLTGQVAPAMGTNQNATGRNTPEVFRGGGFSNFTEGDVASALLARQGRGDVDFFADQEMTVRRLTPRECERLMGLPDDYTRIPWKVYRMLKEGQTLAQSATWEMLRVAEEECPDGPRYAAIGNSIAVPVLRWIAERIEEVEACLRDRP